MTGRAITPDAAAKIGRLIPLMGSDVDGEALGAARAIGRTLKAAGLDLHALADHVRRVSGPGSPDRDPAFVSPDYNYADAFRRARPPTSVYESADAMTRSFGLPIYTEGRLASWMEVAQHCLGLNRSIPKSHGGRFLRDFETKLLGEIAQGSRYPTNAHASWIETVVARCHQARAAERDSRGAA